jgi:hypothetical protein
VAVKRILMPEGQLFLVSANKGRIGNLEWSDDDYDVCEGAADGPVVGRIYKLSVAPTGNWWFWAVQLFPAVGADSGTAETREAARTHSRRSGWSGVGGNIRGSGGPKVSLVHFWPWVLFNPRITVWWSGVDAAAIEHEPQHIAERDCACGVQQGQIEQRVHSHDA